MSTRSSVRLIAHDGNLYTDRSLITCPHLLAATQEKRLMLVAETGEGRLSKTVGVDWPEPNAKILRAALIQARKCGFIPPDTLAVTLPNGIEFSIDPESITERLDKLSKQSKISAELERTEAAENKEEPKRLGRNREANRHFAIALALYALGCFPAFYVWENWGTAGQFIVLIYGVGGLPLFYNWVSNS